MKKIILSICLTLATILSQGQCPTPTNLTSQMTLNGTITFGWNTVGATKSLFVPLNFTPMMQTGGTATNPTVGVVDPAMFLMGGNVGMITFDTTGLCGNVLEWMEINYCFTPTGNFTQDTLNAVKSFSPVQSYLVNCPTPPTTPVIIQNGHHTGHGKKH